MAMKLEDLIGKKKEVAQVLDLSKATANTAEELKKLLDKVPEFRIKPEKIKAEDIKIQDKVSRLKKKKSSKSGKGQSTTSKKYLFGNPIPQEMRSLQLDDVCSVGIQWNMLTTLRPKNKLDEEYFSRIVELGKLRLQTEEKESKFPESFFLRKMKNKAGLVETRYISCAECGEEFCETETCCMFQYDQFRRENLEGPTKPEAKERGRQRTKKKIKRGKKKIRRKTSAPGEIPRRKKSKPRKSKSQDRNTDTEEKKPKEKRSSSKKRSKSAPASTSNRPTTSKPKK